MKKTITIEVETTLESGTLTPIGHWADRDGQVEQDQESREIWEAMTPSEQAAALRVVRDCLAVLYDEMDERIMLSFRPDKPGQYYNIQFRILATSLEESESVIFQLSSLKSKNEADRIRDGLSGVLDPGMVAN